MAEHAEILLTNAIVLTMDDELTQFDPGAVVISGDSILALGTDQELRQAYTAEQVITKLREAEIYLGQGKTVKEASRMLEISEQTYYRWRREYGGMDITQAKKFKEVEKENIRLKKLVADLSLDNAILKEVLGKK